MIQLYPNKDRLWKLNLFLKSLGLVEYFDPGLHDKIAILNPKKYIKNVYLLIQFSPAGIWMDNDFK